MTTLLAVDDSSTMRKVLEITFAGESYETLTASSAEDAMLKLGEHRPPLALIDVTLSPSDGYELCKRVKTEYPETRVVLLASKQNAYDAERGTAAGADDHIDKPFETQALLDKVANLLESPAMGISPSPERPVVAQGTPPMPSAKPLSVPTQSGPAIPSLDFRASGTQPGTGAVAQPAPAVAQQVAKTTAPSYHPVTRPAPSADHRPTALTPQVTIETLAPRLSSLGLTQAQIEGVLALSKEVVEQAVWEVVPMLAETLIKEEIARLTKS